MRVILISSVDMGVFGQYFNFKTTFIFEVDSWI